MPRRFRRRAGGTLSKSVRNYLTGFLWLAVGMGVIAFMSGLGSVLPSSSITIGGGGQSGGGITIQTSLFYQVIGFAVGIIFMLTAVRRILRIRL